MSPAATTAVTAASGAPDRRAHVAAPDLFAINFARGHMLPLRYRRWLTWTGAGALAVNVAVAAVLLVMASRSRWDWSRLRNQLQTESSSAAAGDALKHDMSVLRERATDDLDQLNMMLALERPRFAVGGRLGGLTRTLPARTWVTSVSADREHRTLKVEASYLIDPDRPYELPTKTWVERLQADAQFSQGLKRLELGESTRKMQGQAELFCFTLMAEWTS